VEAAINKKFSEQSAPIATASNGALVQVTVPAAFSSRMVEFLAGLENIEIEADRLAKVVVNERTGTIVMGKQVKVSPIAIMHGNLSVEVQTNFSVSQPEPFSKGTTQVIPEPQVGVKEDKAKNVVLKDGASVEELVRALLAVGTTPRDVIAILQSLRSAGALEAELEVI
jgi:flagellar P-ring protein precursor FlgI